MKRIVFVSCVVLLTIAAIAYALARGQQRAGAVLEPPSACGLLPNGKQWVYDFRRPVDWRPDCGYALEIRRTSKARDPQYSPTMSTHDDWSSEEAAEVILASNVAVNAKNGDGMFALQILDVRDFGSTECANPLRVFGGVQLPGVSANITNDADFLLGVMEGTSVRNTCDWRKHEMCPLRFQTRDETHVYQYDVVLVAKSVSASP